VFLCFPLGERPENTYTFDRGGGFDSARTEEREIFESLVKRVRTGVEREVVMGQRVRVRICFFEKCTDRVGVGGLENAQKRVRIFWTLPYRCDFPVSA